MKANPGSSFWLLLAALCGCDASVDNPFIGGTGGGGAPGGGVSGTGGGVSGTGGGTGGCMEDWQCGAWMTGASGSASRSCIDVNACGTTAHQPVTSVSSLPALDVNFFKCRVEPVLDRSCAAAGCHGSASRALRIFARGRIRNSETVTLTPAGGSPMTVNLATACNGTIDNVCAVGHTATEWQANYDSARVFAIGLSSPDSSELLAQPARGDTTYAHAGRKLLDPQGTDYAAVRQWLAGATLSTCNPAPN
jgi:hypothetical protein